MPIPTPRGRNDDDGGRRSSCQSGEGRGDCLIQAASALQYEASAGWPMRLWVRRLRRLDRGYVRAGRLRDERYRRDGSEKELDASILMKFQTTGERRRP